MHVYRTLDQIRPALSGRAIALGTFDGVHRGHRQVIAAAHEWATANGATSTVVTFDPHPLQVLSPGDPPRLLTPTGVKIDLVAGLGIDEMVLIPFTEEFSRQSAQQFSREVLAQALGARHVSVGANFRFGHRAAGDAALLRAQPEFEAEVVELVEYEGEVVSSSRIRELVLGGQVGAAATLLCTPFQLEGEVARGDARGRELGIPTANIEVAAGMVIPGAGVYAGTARGHAAAISVGVRPTFEQDGRVLVEAHLLDFEGDLYGEVLRLSFLERLRDELRFDSAEALMEQMREDVQATRRIAGT